MYLAVKIRINPMQIFVRLRYKLNKSATGYLLHSKFRGGLAWTL